MTEEQAARTKPSEPADLGVRLAGKRTKMAAFRTSLALDRTTLAWIRTTVTLAGFGFGMVGFFRALREHSPTPESIRMHEGAIRMGVGLVLLGIGAMVLASASHWFTLRRLLRGEFPVLTQWAVFAG